MKFLSDILAKAGLTVDGVVTFNNTATGQTPDANDNSTKLATTAWVRTFVQPYNLPIASGITLGGIKIGSGLNIDGTGIVSVASTGVGAIRALQQITATAGQTVFTVSGGYTAGLIDVFLNGVLLTPTAITSTNGSTFTLADAAIVNDLLDVFVYNPIYNGFISTSDQVPEGATNIYFTNARARTAITLTTTGTSGAATYNSTTGVLNIPSYIGGVVSIFGRTGTVVAASGDYTTTLVTEGTNLYYTDARARASISVTGSGSYNSATGVITVTGGVTSVNTLTGAVVLTTTNIAEGTNLYYTDTRVLAYLTANSYATQTYVGTQIANLVASAPSTLDTLNELAAALGNDPSFATTVATSIGTKVPQSRTITINGTTLDLSADRSFTIASGVTSFNTRTGAITSATGDYTTAQVTESGNLYYTDARVRAAISLTTTGTSGAATYNSTTGVINIPQYQGGVTSFNTRTGAITLSSGDVTTALGYTPVTNARTLSINGEVYDLTADRTWTVGVNPSARAIQTYTATAAQTTFAVTGGYVVGLVDVFINGVRLTSADFTATNGTSVVLAAGTTAGNVVDIVKYTSAFTASSALRQVSYFTATAAQTTFTVSYTPGLVDVFYNGSKLAASEYTASNGTSIVLANAASVNDVIEVVAYAYSVGAFTGQQQLNGTGFVKVSGTTVSYDNSIYQTLLTNPVTGTGITGQVAYFNGTSSITSEANLFWDVTNDRLGVGLVNPQRKLEIYSTTADSHLRLSGSAPSVSLGEAITGSIYQAKFGLATASGQYATGAAAGDFVIIAQTGSTIFSNGSSSLVKLTNGGNFEIGYSGTSQNSFKLDVNGTVRFSGSLTGTSATFSSSVTATSFNLGNGQFLRLTRNSGALQYDAFGIVSGTDNTRIISTGDFDIVNGSLTSQFKIASTGVATFSGPTVTIGSAAAATNVKLLLNGVASKAAGIEFQQNGTAQWYLGNGIASEDNNFELYNSNGTMAMKIIKSTNAISFTGATTFSSSVTIGAATALNFGARGGITQDGSWNFSWNTNSFANAFYLQSSTGNVGINTTTPIGGGGASDRTLSINSGAGAATFITGLINGVKYSTLFTSSTQVVLESNAAIPILFKPNGTTALTLANGGAATFSSSVTAGTDGVYGNNRTANDAGATVLNIMGSSSSSTSSQINLTQVWNGVQYPIVLKNIYNPVGGAASSFFTLSTTQWNGSAAITTERFRVDGNSGATTFLNSVKATTLALGSVDPSTNGIYLNNPNANGANYGYIKTSAVTVNTTSLTLGSTYGYNSPVDALTIFNGSATFANNVTAAGSFYTGGAFISSITPGGYTLDSAGSFVTLANGAFVDFPAMSGMIIVNNTGTGALQVFICGGGNTASLGNVVNVTGTMTHSPGVGGYRFTNNTGSSWAFAFQVFRTRGTA